MKTKTTFLKVNAKERIPEKDGLIYITFYSPDGLGLAPELIFADRKKIHWLAKPCNMYEVYWLEGETTDYSENINLDIDNKTKLTFDTSGELVKI